MWVISATHIRLIPSNCRSLIRFGSTGSLSVVQTHFFSWPAKPSLFAHNAVNFFVIDKPAFTLELLGHPAASIPGEVKADPPLRRGDDPVLTLYNSLCNRMGSLHNYK